jgi:hypothetical protein
MKEAIMALISVFIGAIISIIGQFLVNYFNYKKWQKDRLIEELKSKKENLNKEYRKIKNKLIKGVADNNYDMDMVTTINFLFTKNVQDAFNEMIKDKNNTLDNRKIHLYKIMSEIK